MDTQNSDNPTEAIPTLSTETGESPRPVRIAYLVMGLLFLGIVALAISLDTGTIPWSGARYLGPGLLVVVGAVGLLATVASSRTRKRIG